MSTLDISGSPPGRVSAGFLAKERTIAAPGFNRWLVPPAALCIHLCIGMAYGFSVFWLPLSKAIGITKPLECPTDMSFIASVFSSTCDWKVSTLGWMYTLFFVFLGSAAALWGGWLERVGPRKAAFVSALCWCGGLVISAVGVYMHQIWMLWLGSGVIGGIGLGLGYISPVSTLIKWFPDRRGMATGMAIMGFGGGAMIGSPLADRLMKLYATADSVGVWQTFLTMAAIYFVFMMLGAFGYRIPPTGWKPAGWTAPDAATSKAMITTRHVHLDTAWKTPQFWLIWAVLCLNVSAGIGIIGVASVMLQEIFGGHLVAHPELGFAQVQADAALKAAAAAVGAGFVGVISLFNIGGRFFWASLSDKLGRKLTYFVFFVLGIILYIAMPQFAAAKIDDPVRARVRRHRFDVWRRLLDDSGVSRRHLRHADGWRDPWQAADGVVGRRHPRSGRGQLPSRGAHRGERAARPYLRSAADDHGRPSCRRLHLQFPDQAGRSEVLHDRCRARSRTPARARALARDGDRSCNVDCYKTKQSCAAGRRVATRRHPDPLGRLGNAAESRGALSLKAQAMRQRQAVKQQPIAPNLPEDLAVRVRAVIDALRELPGALLPVLHGIQDDHRLRTARMPCR